MKRTLGFFFLAITAGALAQTPTVVEKPAAKTPASNVKVATSNAKPAPATVKVATVAVQKPSAATAAKVQPVAVKASPAPVAKANTTPAAKVNTATAAKANATPAAKTITPSTTPAKPAVVSLPAASSAVKVVSTKPASAFSAPKTADAHAKTGATQVSSASAQKVKVSTRPNAKPTAAVQSAPKTQPVVAIQNSNTTDAKKTPKAMSAIGHRDPFVSPVVAMGAMGSGCSSGKRCLAIDQIALKGVVKSDNGMIAVVVNAMDKAYFLHENDPVFNGYVVKITGDSIVFKETFHDKLGKALTRDVTKMMSRPVA
jgi:Tfp pilus assembly protein PilP